MMLIQQIDLILNQLPLTVSVAGKSRHIYLKIFGRMNSGKVAFVVNKKCGHV